MIGIDHIHGCMLFYFINTLIVDKLKKRLGEGGFSGVFLVEKETTKEIKVIKLIHLGKRNSAEYENKLKAYKRDLTIGLTVDKRNGFLIRYTEVFEENEFYGIVMEYCSKGDLQKVLDSGKVFTKEVLFRETLLLFYFRKFFELQLIY
jgi:serine/threonine protein kinase